jgi:hypothetical protein
VQVLHSWVLRGRWNRNRYRGASELLLRSLCGLVNCGSLPIPSRSDRRIRKWENFFWGILREQNVLKSFQKVPAILDFSGN